MNTFGEQTGGDERLGVTSSSTCPKCRYDLVGLPDVHACPECGLAYDHSRIVVPGWLGNTPEFQRNMGIAWAVVALILAVLTAATAWLAFRRGSVADAGLPLAFFVFFTYQFISFAPWARRRGESKVMIVFDNDGLAVWKTKSTTRFSWSDTRPPELVRRDRGRHAIRVERSRSPWKRFLVGTGRTEVVLDGERDHGQAVLDEMTRRYDQAHPSAS